MKPKITDAQRIAFDVLLEIGGWATSQQMQSHGGNIAAAMALIKHGMVEQRTYASHWGTDCNEWRAIKPMLSNAEISARRCDGLPG